MPENGGRKGVLKGRCCRVFHCRDRGPVLGHRRRLLRVSRADVFFTGLSGGAHQVTSEHVAARMDTGQAGPDGTAQVTGRDIARWMDIPWPAVAGMSQATAHPAGDDCHLGLQPCGFPPQASLQPGACNSHIRLPSSERDGQVNPPPGESSFRFGFVVHRAGMLSLAGWLRR